MAAKSAREVACRNAKSAGRKAATAWLENAGDSQTIEVAGCEFLFGDTLDDLIEDGFEVPHSSDPHFSLGFFKQVKWYVHLALYKLRLHRNAKDN